MNLGVKNANLNFIANWSPTVKVNRSNVSKITISHNYYEPVAEIISRIKKDISAREKICGRISNLCASPNSDERKEGIISISYLDKNDFLYFNDSDLRSVSSKELSSIINNPVNNYNVILIDINDSAEEANCTEMLYLIEPSTLRLNKMIRKDRSILNKMRGMKIVLNKSLLDASDIRDFESEAGCSVFHNIPPLDDKKDKHRVLDELLNKLGFDKNRPVGDNSRAARLFGIVKE